MSDAKKITRPLPRPDAYMETGPFWQAANDGKLLIQYCKDTGQYQWFPRPVSIYTGSRNVEWREVSGNGTLYTWTIATAPWPGHQDRVPYLCAIVELDEGVRIVTNLVNCTADDLEDGMPMKLAWDRLSEDFNFPVFEPR
jgi:uncharacterized OB-fold protein